MAGADTLTFNDANFAREVLESDLPVMVDFYADWCMPCRTIAPMIDELATEFAGKVRVGKHNVETDPEYPHRYSVGSIPTILIFKGGEVVQKFLGLTQKKDFQAALASVTR